MALSRISFSKVMVQVAIQVRFLWRNNSEPAPEEWQHQGWIFKDDVAGAIQPHF